MTEPAEEDFNLDDLDLDAASGMEAANAAVKAERAARAAKAGRDRVPYLKLDPKNESDDGTPTGNDERELFFRLISPPWKIPGRKVTVDQPCSVLTVGTHWVPTKEAPAYWVERNRKLREEGKDEKRWPSRYSSVCQASGLVAKLHPQGCWVENNNLVEPPNAPFDKAGKPIRASLTGYALVQLVDVIRGTQADADAGRISPRDVNRIIDARDRFEDVAEIVDDKPTGRIIRQYAIRVLQQYHYGAGAGFWAALNSAAETEGSGTSNVWRLVADRNGAKGALRWTPTMVSTKFGVPDPDDVERFQRGEITEDQIGTIPHDLSDPRVVRSLYGFEQEVDGKVIVIPPLPRLEKILVHLASDDWYRQWYIPGEGETRDENHPPQQNTPPPTAALEKLQGRVPQPMPAAEVPTPATSPEAAPDFAALESRIAAMGGPGSEVPNGSRPIRRPGSPGSQLGGN